MYFKCNHDSYFILLTYQQIFQQKLPTAEPKLHFLFTHVTMIPHANLYHVCKGNPLVTQAIILLCRIIHYSDEPQQQKDKWGNVMYVVSKLQSELCRFYKQSYQIIIFMKSLNYQVTKNTIIFYKLLMNYQKKINMLVMFAIAMSLYAIL